MRTVAAGGDMEREGIKRLVQVVEAGPGDSGLRYWEIRRSFSSSKNSLLHSYQRFKYACTYYISKERERLALDNQLHKSFI